MKRIFLILTLVFITLNAEDGLPENIDEMAARGAMYDNENMLPPSQNPNLNPNADFRNRDSLDSLPHDYPLTDRLNSSSMSEAQVKNGLEFAKDGDLVNAFKSFKKACEAGNAAGCFGLGTMYANGKGVDLSIAKAKKYYELGCGAGDMNSCTNLAMLYADDQKASKRDKEMAVQFYMTACQGGDAIACNNLGFMYANGDGVTKNYFTSLQYYKLSCSYGSNLGCYNLGLATNTNNMSGKNKDQLSQADINYTACNAGDIKACSNLGFMYANGKGNAPQSYVYAAKYFKKACEAGDVISCSNMGVLYQKGLGVVQNIPYALDLYTYACNAGLQEACDNYRILKQDLEITPMPSYKIKPKKDNSRTTSAYKR